MTDARALVKEARREHVRCGAQCPEPLCVECAEDWPCLTARLAEALDESQQSATVEAALHDITRAERDAAVQRAERLAGYTRHKPHCSAAPYEPHPGYYCSCGLDVALDLAAGRNDG